MESNLASLSVGRWTLDVGRFGGRRPPLRFSGICSLLVSLSLVGCANHHFRTATESPAGAPRSVELLKEKQVATLHFPAGTYPFYASDDKGYYYSSPRPVFEHTGIGSVPRDGGIFVNRRNSKKLRGYIYLAGDLTHIGDLSRTPHRFRE
jgi:hypothetical protein